MSETACVVPSGARAGAGFSLIELLLAATLGAMLVMGVARMSGMFAQHVTAARAEPDTAMERALNTVSDATRQAWIVESPAVDHLDVQDALGNQTSFYVADGALKVARPDGDIGTLLGGVTHATFELETMRRLREAPPVTNVDTPWAVTEPNGTAGYFTLSTGTELALGFTVPSLAPASAQLVPDVTEKRLSGTLDKLYVQVTSTNGSQGKISPVLECVYDNGDGTYIAYFGYLNPNPYVVTIPVGSANKFTPNPQDRGQVTVFLTGRHNFVFEVPFDGSSGNQVWTLNGRTSTANSGSKKCGAPGAY